MRGNRNIGPGAVHYRRSIPACAGEPRWRGRPGNRRAVYPRVCGGTRDKYPAARSRRGLSPRVRGNQVRRGVQDGQVGSIPACAGEPHCHRAERRYLWVYPRVCGGTVASLPRRHPPTGLSPRVRGNQSNASSLQCTSGVYPRVCGGTSPMPAAAMHVGGLSPRVRGNPGGCIRPGPFSRGSIPACAGEPCSLGVCGVGARVYPRVCGGTSRLRPEHGRAWGLSPRVRGNQPNQRASMENQRSIPACAGEPTLGIMGALVALFMGSIPACAGEPERYWTRNLAAAVYPRVCGGTRRHAGLNITRSGLSPRVRGNLQNTGGEAVSMRSIPACAGEPWSRRLPGGLRGVYPRVCGGTSSPLSRHWICQGLSPRVRGNRRRYAQEGHSVQVYPRVCGGTIVRTMDVDRMDGLSPRVRGNPVELSGPGQ